MDERLEAGRHHLFNGEKALREGYLDESRSHWEAALLQFRGPELRLGEAHALRGLARVELGCGRPQVAERSARQAILAYQEARAILDRVDVDGVSVELRRDAEEGEGTALALLGDILLRLGREEEARTQLERARDLFARLGAVPSAASMWLTLGRSALRAGRFPDAREAFEQALRIHEQSGRVDGQCHAWLALAEAWRLEGALEPSQAALGRALELAQEAGEPALEGRVFSNQGALALARSELSEARECYALALACFRRAGDAEHEAFALLGAGEALSRAGDDAALASLAEGAKLLASLENRHGLGTAMLRAARHLYDRQRPELALAAAEGARQLWASVDPVRGVGQTLRLTVKAFAALERRTAAAVAAHLRAEIAGGVQPNALEVRDWYRGRAPRTLLEELDGADREHLQAWTERLLAEALAPVLEPLGLEPAALGTLGASLALLERLTGPPAPSDEEPS